MATREEEKARKRAHYLAHRDEYLARARAQRAAQSPEERAAYNADYRRKNAERLRVKRQEYYEKHREHVIAKNMDWWKRQGPAVQRAYLRAYYAEHGERLRTRASDYKRQNKDRVNVANARRYANQRTAPPNDLTAEQWRALKKAYGQRCAYCGSAPPRLTMDHVVPLIRRGSHTARNIVPACAPCNFRKNRYAALPFAVLPLYADLVPAIWSDE